MSDQNALRKNPYGVELKKGKEYSWCTCGLTKTEPFCDTSHREKTELKSLKFQVDENKTYWLCGCKQSKNKPFCDGTHKKL